MSEVGNAEPDAEVVSATPPAARRGLDRFTLAVAGATVGLVAIALGLVLMRPAAGQPMDEASPLGVANNYYLALVERDTKKAYDYLSVDARAKTSYADFARRTPPGQSSGRIRLVDERIDGDSARVATRQTSGSPGFFPFSSGEYTSDWTLVLKREDGAWKLAQPHYYY